MNPLSEDHADHPQIVLLDRKAMDGDAGSIVIFDGREVEIVAEAKGTAFCFILALHEAGHVVAARAFGAEILSVSVGSTGGEVIVKSAPSEFLENAIFTLAGEAATAVLVPYMALEPTPEDLIAKAVVASRGAPEKDGADDFLIVALTIRSDLPDIADETLSAMLSWLFNEAKTFVRHHSEAIKNEAWALASFAE